MSKKLILLVSVVLALGLVSGAKGDVIDSFENGPGAWEIIDPPETLAQGTEGVTDGTYSLQRNFTAGWHFIDLDISGFVDVLNANDTLEIDVTTSLTAEQVGWYLEHLIILQGGNAAGSYYLEGPLVSVASPDGTLTTTTVAFNYGPALADGPLTDWAKIRLVNNTGGDGVLYYDNLRAVSSAPAPPSSGDTVIGNWEQDMDGWVVSATADALFNDHNGVTLDNYSLDIFIPNGDWQTFLTLDVLANGLLDLFKVNQEISVDVTRLVADWPTDQGTFGWNGIHMVINAGGDGWELWQDMGYRVHWLPPDGDLTQTATWDYGQYLPLMDLETVTWLELEVVSNADDPAYTGGVLFYLDNMKLTGAGVALDPQPADGATDVPIDTTLNWTAGTFATSHHLYFGTDLIKVSDADMDSDPNVVFAELDVANFDPNGLEFKTRYFWRVDEVNEANPDSPWKSPVWSFTAADFLIIDDFESYNDIDPPDPESHTIFEAWADGYGIPTNGALVGHDVPPYAAYVEQTTVRNGIQSMPFYYDNTGEALQSETQRVWSEPQVWMTGAGSNTLKLSTHGAALNTAGELYVIIEDSAGVSHKVVNTDSAIFTTEEWTEWAISLNDVAASGVNLAAVKKLVIGIADLPGQAEASGILYVDDIRRHPPVVVSLDPDHLVVPKTSVAPVIDGQWDAVWNDVNETRCLITDMSNTDSDTPEDSNDLSAIFKAFFDDSNFYIFVEVHDSVIDYEFSDWQGDGVEIYFDGDYSHGDTYDGVNDNQIRITVDDVVLTDIDNSVPIDGTVFKVLLTASGYNIEASFPLEALQIYPSEDPAPLVDADGVEIPGSGIAPNNIIGFEVQINDNDSAGGRQTIMRWHSDDNDSYQNPSLFGQARLVSSTVGN